MFYYKTVVYIDIDSGELSDLPKLNEIVLESSRFNKMSLIPANTDIECFTNPKTLKWFNVENLANHITLVDPKLMVFQKNFLTMLVMKVWVACVLDLDCIAPEREYSKNFGDFFSCETLCECHRYDQSALSIINYIFMNALF